MALNTDPRRRTRRSCPLLVLQVFALPRQRTSRSFAASKGAAVTVRRGPGRDDYPPPAVKLSIDSKENLAFNNRNGLGL